METFSPSPSAIRKMMPHNDKLPWWNIEEKTVNSIITPLSVCREQEGEFSSGETVFFFSNSSAGAALSGFHSEHDDKRLKRAERDQRDKINFSSLDPVTPGAQRESRRESQLSAPRLGRFEVGSGEVGTVDWLRTGKYCRVCMPPGVCLCLWRGMGGLEVNDSNAVTSSDEIGDGD
ncbi:Elongation factor G [Dissostichus eleginoides]|uniref:Elongation factor G n=1 Tax=Dissostichus eleginoides TaxID=100907 RepID=A0AAD9CTT1_DISEL|nr:Elongation factor G [Dissostichus eleginoides]